MFFGAGLPQQVWKSFPYNRCLSALSKANTFYTLYTKQCSLWKGFGLTKAPQQCKQSNKVDLFWLRYQLVISETYVISAMGIILSIAMLIANFRWLAQSGFLLWFVWTFYTVLQDFSYMSTVSCWTRMTYIGWVLFLTKNINLFSLAALACFIC